jgi:membrane fusion protein (multidrug efflux system)
MQRQKRSPWAGAPVRSLLLTIATLGLSGCGGEKPAKAPPEVGFAVLQPATAPLLTELPGRTSAFRTAEVRPQVSGVIQQRLFTEGATVHQGQPLYRIDASLYAAATRQAAANLASAQASAEATGAKAARYRPLAAEQAVAQQDFTDAAAAARVAAAQVAQNRASLATARINLRFTTVPAPITGQIGRSLVTEGALATADQPAPLAVISQLDPIYVDIQQSATDLLTLRHQLAGGGATAMRAKVRLRLDDDSEYPHDGTLEFSEVTADPATGTVTLRLRFPNPDGMLLPGMFVRAEVTQASQSNIFLVPQSALTRDARGNAVVFLVDANNHAELRKITAERTLGDKWVVTAGLKRGEKLITQGIGRIKPGLPIHPVPDTTPQQPLADHG